MNETKREEEEQEVFTSTQGCKVELLDLAIRSLMTWAGAISLESWGQVSGDRGYRSQYVSKSGLLPVSKAGKTRSKIWLWQCNQERLEEGLYKARRAEGKELQRG